MKAFFFLFVLLLAVLVGYRMGEGPAIKKKSASKGKTAVNPQKQYPVSEHKSFVFVVHSHRQADWCERSLQSIFEQDYEDFRVIFFDDASKDGTFEKVQEFALKNNQEHRIILIQNPTRLGSVACLYRAVEQLLDEEIAIPMDAKNWLLHERALSGLNKAYQNPDVWMTAGAAIQYPEYAMADVAPPMEEHLPSQVPVSFYAGLFKQVHLVDLMQEGYFVEGRDAYLTPMLQMAAGRCCLVHEPLVIENLARVAREIQSKSFGTYSAMSAFSSRGVCKETADIVLFSCDRPMQLYACLESIQRYFSGYEQIVVICRANDPRQKKAYLQVQDAFSDVRFVFQSSKPKKDFKPILLKILSESPSNFVLFGVDDQVVTDFTNLKECLGLMERTGAYGFYLRLGQHITHCYQTGKEQTIPTSVSLGQGVFAWNLKVGNCDWEFPNTLDMTLYRKTSLESLFKTMRYRHPNSLEFAWAKRAHPEREIGLYFEHAKVLNVPLNIVSPTGNPHMDSFSVEDLLLKFEEGFKMNIDPLYRFDNASPHMEYQFEFVR